MTTYTKILIVEDEAGVREFVKRGLLSVGYDVVAVEDGEQALEQLSKDSFSLMITDVVMPRMDGISLALKTAKQWPHMPILLMTGYATERQRAYNMETLSHVVLAKPFSLKSLIDTVHEALSPTATP